MKNLNALLVFVRVAESQSFKLAGERLGLTPSAVSKSIAKLEAELNTRLLQRSTRKVALTNDGQFFYTRCLNIFHEIEDAQNALTMNTQLPQGKLKVQMPVGFGRRVIMPKLLAFSQTYPELLIDIEMSDRVIDPLHEDIDLSIHIGKLYRHDVVAKKIGRLSFAACASPQYLSKFGEPQTPDELDRHNCLAYLLTMGGQYRDWVFLKEGKILTKELSGNLNINNAESLLELAKAGAGITMISNFIAADAIKAGQLKRILTDYLVEGPEIHLLYKPSRTPSQKVNAFMEFVKNIVEEIDVSSL
jgi:LysR family transcriptional regulator for bpeEF and oprC